LAAAAQRLDTSRLSFGEKVAGISAVVLLIDLWLPWYGASVKGGVGQFQISRSENANAWEAFGGRDLLLLLISLVVIGYVLARLFDALPAIPVDGGLVILVLGALGVLATFIGILHIPTNGAESISSSLVKVDFSRKIGLFIGFLATCGITYGGWAAYNEARRGFGPAAAGPGGSLGGPGAVTPPAGAGPGAGAAQPATSSSAPTTPLSTPPASTPPASTPPSSFGTPPASTPPASSPPASEPPASTPPSSFGTSPASTPPVSEPPASTGPASTPSTPSPGPASPTPPSQPAAQNPPADWYPDPHGQARLRWWDGSQWTDQTAD
jgi:hypothetical protein